MRSSAEYFGNARLTKLSWHSVLVAKSHHNDYIDWDSRREGYLDVRRTPTYANVKTPGASNSQTPFISIALETRFGSLLAGGGMIWAAYNATKDYAGLWQLRLAPPGPLEICALGILIWLHAKWRRSTKPE